MTVVEDLRLPIRSSIACGNLPSYMTVVVESKRPKRPRDPNQLAKLIADIAAGNVEDLPVLDDGRDMAAVMLGRRGGLKGGPARAARLSPDERRRIAAKAARARWGKGNE